MYLRSSCTRRLQTGKLGFFTTTASAILTAEAEADDIIHAGYGCVNGEAQPLRGQGTFNLDEKGDLHSENC
jgi:hypothetical protein